MKKILIIEDDTDIINILETQLLSQKFDVWKSYNGEEALKLILDKGLPDLIISDVIMPRMDGITFLEKFNKLFSDNKVPFIFLTEKRSTEDKLKAYQKGAYRYISKPFQIKKILNIVVDLLFAPEDYKVDLIKHNSNITTLQIHNNPETIMEINDIICGMISELDLPVNIKNHYSSLCSELFADIKNFFSIYIKNNDLTVKTSYLVKNKFIEIVFEFLDNKNIIEKFKKFLHNFSKDIKFDTNENYIKFFIEF